MKNLTWQNPEQLFVAQELINKVKSKCCGIKDNNILSRSTSIFDKAGAEYSNDGKVLISLNTLSPDIISYRVKPGVERLKFGVAQLAKNIHEIIIPHGVECIPGAAFRCSSLTKIILPKSLKIIEQDAFESCDELQTIDIPEGVETIDYSAFFSCQKLESVSFPSTLLKLGRSFAYSKSLKIVRFKGTTEVHEECFSNCLSLHTIFIPERSRMHFEAMLPDLKDILVEELFS